MAPAKMSQIFFFYKSSLNEPDDTIFQAKLNQEFFGGYGVADFEPLIHSIFIKPLDQVANMGESHHFYAFPEPDGDDINSIILDELKSKAAFHPNSLASKFVNDIESFMAESTRFFLGKLDTGILEANATAAAKSFMWYDWYSM